MTFERIIEIGSYSGNGGTQSISIGWKPCLVFIGSGRTSGPPTGRAFSCKVPDMSGDDFMGCHKESEMFTTNGITLVADGFDIGSDDKINKSGIPFHWVAIMSGPWADSGIYTKTLSPINDKIILGRQPDLIFNNRITGPGANSKNEFQMKHKEMTDIANHTYRYDTKSLMAGPLEILSDGFLHTLSSDAGKDFAYVALFDTVGSTRHFESGRFLTNEINPRTITVGVRPKFVICNGESHIDFGFKTNTMSSADTSRLKVGTGGYAFDTSTNGITIISTGFTVGSDFNTHNPVSGDPDDVYWLVGYD